MFKILEGTEGNVLGVEIIGGYTKADFEAFKETFEEHLKGHERVNVLCKIDQMKLTEGEIGAFVSDAKYALSNKDKMRHIAIVADSTLFKLFVKMDNAILGDPKIELVEKYFDIQDIEQAWNFVRN